MPVYFNGTSVTDPYFNGTRLDYIYFNGTLVYQRSTPYYAIQNGYKQSGAPNAYAWYTNGYSNVTGEALNDINNAAFFGASGHTNGSESHEWGADTGTIPTSGCSNLTIETYFESPDGWDATLTVWGDGTQIKTESIATNSYSTSRVVGISGYSNVRVRIAASANSTVNSWYYIGFRNVRIHN